MPSRFLKHFLWPSYLVLLLLAPSLAWSAVTLDDLTYEINLNGQVEVLEDTTGQLDFAEVRNAIFRPSSEFSGLNLGYRQGAIWLKLELYSAATTKQTWRVVFDYASLDTVLLYNQGAEHTYTAKAGDRIPKHEHSLDYRTPLFEVSLAPNESRTLYIRVSSDGALTLTGKLMSLSAFEQLSRNGYIAHSLYFGVYLALALYNLLLFFALKERPFLNYVFFLSGFVVGMASLNGYGAQFLWTGGEAWSNRILPVSMTVTELFAVIFARSFLDTKTRAPKIDFWLRLMRDGTLLAIISSLLAPSEYATQIMSITGVGFTSALLATGFYCVYRQVPGAALFTSAWLVLIVGSGLMAMRNIGLIPSNFMTLYAMQIGSALEMILLSLALASRFNALKREREAILRESERMLEQRVLERTLALEEANQRLSDLALKDPLTTLANRNALRAHLESLLERHTPLALMLIDLDGFKPVNDRYGHEVGDGVLVKVAERLRRVCAHKALVARLGGDEFVVVCEAPAQAQELGQKILTALKEPMQAGEYTVHIGASIGLTFSCEHDSKQTLLKRADTAMYQAKAQGRNCLSLSQQSPSALAFS